MHKMKRIIMIPAFRMVVKIDELIQAFLASTLLAFGAK